MVNRDKIIDRGIIIAGIAVLYIFSATMIAYIAFRIIYADAIKDLSPLDQRSPQFGFFLLVVIAPKGIVIALISGIPATLILSFLARPILRRFGILQYPNANVEGN